MKIHIFLWHYFPSAWRTSFRNSYCAGLLIINFLLFLYLNMSLFLFYCSRIFLMNIVLLSWQFFPFVNMKILSNCPLASLALDKKTAAIGIIYPVYVMLHFIWLLLRFSLSLKKTKHFDYDIPRCSVLRIFPVCVLLNFLNLYIYAFHQILGVYGNLSSTIFISPIYSPLSWSIITVC